jgi:hypothetical protein
MRYAKTIAHTGYYRLNLAPGSSTSPIYQIPLCSLCKGQHHRARWFPHFWIHCKAFGIHWFPSGILHVTLSCSRECGRWCMLSNSNTERVESCSQMARIRVTSWRKQFRGLSTSKCIIAHITILSMLVEFIIPWLMPWTVIYPHHWSFFAAPCCATLSCSGKRIQVCIRKLPSHGLKWRNKMVRTTSTTGLIAGGTEHTVLQQGEGF